MEVINKSLIEIIMNKDELKLMIFSLELALGALNDGSSKYDNYVEIDDFLSDTIKDLRNI